MSSRRYLAYGLSVSTDFPLRSLPPTSESVDIAIISGTLRSYLAHEPSWLLQHGDRDAWFNYGFTEDGWIQLRWRSLFEFAVSPDGQTVLADPLEKGSAEAFETHLLSQVLSTAMLVRGIEPLHATVLQTEHGAVGFLGDSGFGKSSLAAAFLIADDRLVTDDLLVTRAHGDGFRVMPGPRRVKLLPSTARRLLGDDTGVAINDRTRKMIIPLPASRCAVGPVPLVALYALRRPARLSTVTRTTVRSMKARAAFVELTKNTFNSIVLAPERLRVQFDGAARLARDVPVKSLSYPKGLGRLGDVRDRVLDDIARQR